MRANPSQLSAYASRDYGVGNFASPVKSCANLTAEEGWLCHCGNGAVGSASVAPNAHRRRRDDR
jgi:hypothetical protein